MAKAELSLGAPITARWPFAPVVLGRRASLFVSAGVVAHTAGFAAVYTRRGTGEIVGATLMAAHAGEMISELTLAILHKVPLEILADTVHCYPTQAEVFQRVALEYAKVRKTPASASYE
jgi:hypothetical protein